jgi:hypothetical protein
MDLHLVVLAPAATVVAAWKINLLPLSKSYPSGPGKAGLLDEYTVAW